MTFHRIFGAGDAHAKGFDRRASCMVFQWDSRILRAESKGQPYGSIEPILSRGLDILIRHEVLLSGCVIRRMNRLRPKNDMVRLRRIAIPAAPMSRDFPLRPIAT
jgi:hypothetical protein